MSQRIIVAFFTLLLVCSFTSSAYASDKKPHHKPHPKKVKKVKRPHHRGHGR